MKQLAGIPTSLIDTKDPLIAEWALERLETLAEQDRPAADAIAAPLFDTSTIERLLELFGEYSACQLLQTLADPLFAGSIETLTAKWERGEGATAPLVLSLIARLFPLRAEELIRENLEGSLGINVQRLWAIRKSLPFLSPGTAVAMAEEIVQKFSSRTEPEILSLYADEMLSLTCSFVPSRLGEVLPLVLGDDAATEHTVQARFYAAAEFLCGGHDDFAIVADSHDEISSLKLVELAPLFTPAAPLDECERAISELRSGRLQATLDLFADHQSRIADERVVALLWELSQDRTLQDKLGKNKAQPYIHCLLLASLLNACRAEHPAYAALSPEETVSLLAADLRDLPDFDRLVEHLRGMERSNLTSLLIAALERTENHYGGANVVRCMGCLGFSEFIEPILAVAGSDCDYIGEEAEKVFAAFGEEAVEPIIARALEFDDGVFYLLGALSSIGGERVKSFAFDHFHALYEFDREYAMHLIEQVPDERFIRLLAPCIDRGFAEVDKTYLLLHKLFGIRSAEVGRLEAAYFKGMEEQRLFRAALDSGHVIDTVESYLDLELKCLECDAVRGHRVHRVIISGTSPYVADEIVCPDCGKEAEFEVTATGKRVITGASLRLMMIADEEEKRKALEITPLSRRRYVLDSRSREVGILDGICHYLSEMERRPNVPEPVIALGTVYKNVGKFGKAERYLRQAIEMDPAYLEPYFSLASIAEERGDWLSAFTWLDTIRRRMPLVKLRSDMPPNERTPYLETFVGFYNDMLEKSGGPGESMERVAMVSKVGRNDPCPCGSGKKYKKCCLK
jgi:tetratricopeptide (TPR) repeat protein